MNYSIIVYIIRYILCCEGILMLAPTLCGIIYGEKEVLSFVITVALCFFLAFPFTLKKTKDTSLHAKEGFVSVALSWIIMSVIGALPFIISGAIPNPVNALFETVSGFTTTGASILSDVESLPHCIIFWRSFTHWIGGMGVLVFILTVFPASSGGNMNLMRAESPGPSVDKLVPKVQTTAKILYGIYMVLTILQIILLLAGGMSVFDALTTAFGTAGTGGFGIKNDSMAGYSPYIQVVITVFMILFGVNFNAYFLLLMGRFKKAVLNTEVIVYFIIIATSITIITVNIQSLFDTTVEAIRHSAFQVGSIITTTGFVTTDFNLWPQVSKTVLVMLMFIGACAGSTGGGIKVSRIIILVKTIKKELYGYAHPKGVKKLTLNSKPIEHEVVRSANVYMVAYVIIFAASILFISFDGKDLISNFTAVAATFNNIGPGLELVGPTGNYLAFSVPSKIVLIFDMLAGRLEIFPMLMLFYPQTWKKF